MRHGRSTVKFKYGQDANEMLKRKLLKNFLMHGKLSTTESKIKYLKTQVEILVQRGKKNTEASKNQLLQTLGDPRLVSLVVKEVVPVFKDRVSGFTTTKRLAQRESDGTMVLRLEWISPVVFEKKVEVVKTAKPVKVEAPRSVAKKTKVTKEESKNA